MAATTVGLLLRGVNLGAHNRIAMADLRTLATDLDFGDVRTYVQSGNLVATTGLKPLDAAALLERSVAERLGVDCAVIARTSKQLRAAVDAAPVDAKAETHCYVCYLERKPAAKAVETLLARDFGKDALSIVGTTAYLTFDDTPHRSPLSNALLERALGVRATARNLRTARALAEMAGG